MPQPYAIFHYFKHLSYHRQEGQGTSDELRGRDFRRDLEERERTVRDKRDRNRGRISAVFFLAPLMVESLRQIRYTAKCAFIKV